MGKKNTEPRFCDSVIYLIMLLAQIVRSGLLIDKLRKAVPVLFRCPKIRKAKPACFTFSRSDVNGVQRAILGSRSLVCHPWQNITVDRQAD